MVLVSMEFARCKIIFRCRLFEHGFACLVPEAQREGTRRRLQASRLHTCHLPHPTHLCRTSHYRFDSAQSAMGAASCYNCSCNCDDQAHGRNSFTVLQSASAMCPNGDGDGDEWLADAVTEVTAKKSELEIAFILPDTSMQRRVFTQRPLGLDFNRHMPVTIKHVRPGSHAEELGIRQGWRVQAINGYDATRASFQDVYSALRGASELLQG